MTESIAQAFHIFVILSIIMFTNNQLQMKSCRHIWKGSVATLDIEYYQATLVVKLRQIYHDMW